MGALWSSLCIRRESGGRTVGIANGARSAFAVVQSAGGVRILLSGGHESAVQATMSM